MRKASLFILLMQALSIANASAQVSCPDPAVPAKSWWSASAKQVKDAPCTRNSPFSATELKALVKPSATSMKKSEVVNGISFENEDPALLSAFKDLTSLHNVLGEQVKSKKFNSACKTVLCASQQIFGEKEGLQLLVLRKQYGFNASALAHENTSAFTAAELDHILLGVSDFPANLVPLDNGHPIQRYPRGKKNPLYGGAEVEANAEITFFDPWDVLKSPEEKRMIVFHEMGHVMASRLKNYDNDPKWIAISGWKKKKDVWTAGKKDQILSEYGLTNPEEDFAETVVAYRYNAAQLLIHSPLKYQFMKDAIFGGVEYQSEKTCGLQNSYENTLAKEVNSKVDQYQFSPPRLMKAVSHCAPSALTGFTHAPFDVRKNPEVSRCLKQFVLSDVISNDPAIKNSLLTQHIDQSKIPFHESEIRSAEDFLQSSLFNAMKSTIPEFVDEARAYHSCSKAEITSSQAVEAVHPDFSKKFDSANELFAYNHSKNFGAILGSVCSELAKQEGPNPYYDLHSPKELERQEAALRLVMPSP